MAMLGIEKTPNVFETNITILKDVTAFGNKFYLQLEDSELEDHSFLDKFKGETYEATIILKRPLSHNGTTGKKENGI